MSCRVIIIDAERIRRNTPEHPGPKDPEMDLRGRQGRRRQDDHLQQPRHAHLAAEQKDAYHLHRPRPQSQRLLRPKSDQGSDAHPRHQQSLRYGIYSPIEEIDPKVNVQSL